MRLGSLSDSRHKVEHIDESLYVLRNIGMNTRSNSIIIQSLGRRSTCGHDRNRLQDAMGRIRG